MKRSLTACLLLWMLLAAHLLAQGLEEPKVGVDLDLSGYYRVRYDHFFNLGWAYGIEENWREYFDQRFRLAPTFGIGDRIAIRAQLDLLDNVLFGQNTVATEPFLAVDRARAGDVTVPEVLDVDLTQVRFDTGSVFAETTSSTNRNLDEVPSVQLRRVWASVLLPFGRFDFGRQPSQWGMGILENAGDGIDDDHGDTYDRLRFSTKIGPVVPGLAYSRLAEGNVDSGLSDIHQANLDVKYVSVPAKAGAYLAWRGQGSTDTSLFFYDLWARGEIKGFTIEGEAAWVQGTSVQVERDLARELEDAGYPVGEGGGKIDVGAMIAALRFQYDAPAWGTGLAAGFSSPRDKDRYGEFDPRAAANLERARQEFEGDPNDADSRADFLEAVTRNQAAFARSIRTYPFDRDYTVDLLLWEEAMGGAVENGIFVKAFGRANPFEWMNLRLGLIKSWIAESGKGKDGHGASTDLGWELDGAIAFRMARYFRMDLQAGYLWSGQYFRDAVRRPKDALTIQSNFAVEF